MCEKCIAKLKKAEAKITIEVKDSKQSIELEGNHIGWVMAFSGLFQSARHNPKLLEAIIEGIEKTEFARLEEMIQKRK